MSSEFAISGPFNRYDRKAFFKAFNYDDLDDNGKIRGQNEGYKNMLFGVKVDKDDNGEITESEIKDCLNDDQKLKELLKSKSGREMAMRAVLALVKGSTDINHRDWISSLLFVHFINNKNISINPSIRLLAMEYYRQAVSDARAQKYIDDLKEKEGIDTVDIKKEAKALHSVITGRPGDLLAIKGPFNKYDPKALYKAFGYEKEDEKITERELKNRLINDNELEKLLASKGGAEVVAKAVYVLVRGSNDPKHRDWIGSVLFVNIIDNKKVNVPLSIRLLALEYFRQAVSDPGVLKYVESLKQKTGIVAAETFKEVQSLHNIVIGFYAKLAIPKVFADPGIARLLNPLLEEIDSYVGGLSEPVTVYNGKHLSIYHYSEKPDYYLVCDKKKRLITIIPSISPLKIDGNKLSADYPFNFMVIFDNFEKTIYRNNWCLKWLYRLAKNMNFHRDLRSLKFSDKIKPRIKGMYFYSKEISIYWNADDSVIPHELCHYWGKEVAKAEEIKTFTEISWNGARDFRKDAVLNNFFGNNVGPCDNNYFDCSSGEGIDICKSDHPYGMTNWEEDFATLGQDYIVSGPWMRDKIRKQMKQGNFNTALKYLFFKYLSPVAGGEFGISKRSASLTIDEVKGEMNAYLANHPDGISKNNLEIFNRIETVSRPIREIKREENDVGIVAEDFPLTRHSPLLPEPPQTLLLPVPFPQLPLLSIEEQFKQKYPNTRKIIIDKSQLRKWGLSESDLQDKAKGWHKLSRALYKEDLFWNELKKMNGNRSCPYWSYWTDFYLPGEVVNIGVE